MEDILKRLSIIEERFGLSEKGGEKEKESGSKEKKEKKGIFESIISMSSKELEVGLNKVKLSQDLNHLSINSLYNYYKKKYPSLSKLNEVEEKTYKTLMILNKIRNDVEEEKKEKKKKKKKNNVRKWNEITKKESEENYNTDECILCHGDAHTEVNVYYKGHPNNYNILLCQKCAYKEDVSNTTLELKDVAIITQGYCKCD